MVKLDELPEDCFSHILSFTSSIDACRVSVVSSILRRPADSDTVWEKFLPSDYPEILSRLLHPFSYSSKKDLFCRLCCPHFIDAATKIISLDKSTAKKCYILSARELSITWATNPLYWSWKPFPQSRFSEVAELRTICWLQIQAKFKTHILSSATHYGVYLVVKFADRAYGLNTLPSAITLEIGNFKTKSKVLLHCRVGNYKHCYQSSSSRDPIRPCWRRRDGWFEIELGSFYNGGDVDEEVKACLEEVTGEHLKGGLIVEGIEVRPKIEL